MNARRIFLILGLLLLIMAFLFWWNNRPDTPKTAETTCEGVACDEIAYIDSSCNLVDADGNPLGGMDVKVGTRLCLFNQSGCPVDLKFRDEMFGASLATASLESGNCLNRTIIEGAVDSNFEMMCKCTDGGGHGNPEIRVGGGEEGGGSR